MVVHWVVPMDALLVYYLAEQRAAAKALRSADYWVVPMDALLVYYLVGQKAVVKARQLVGS